MAYLDAEIRSVGALWHSVADRVVSFVLITAGMCFASWLLLSLGYSALPLPPADTAPIGVF